MEGSGRIVRVIGMIVGYGLTVGLVVCAVVSIIALFGLSSADAAAAPAPPPEAGRLVDFSAVLTDEHERPIKDQLPGADPKADLTLGLAAAHALFQIYPDEPSVTVEMKFKRAALAMRLLDAKGPIDVDAGDIDLIKRLVGKLYGPLIIYRILPLLDPPAAKP